MLGRGDVLVDNVGDLEMRQVSQEPSVRGGKIGWSQYREERNVRRPL